MDAADIDNRFAYHRPAEGDCTTPGKLHEIRESARQLAHDINDLAPNSREKSIAITACEEAMMWGIAAVVRNQ